MRQGKARQKRALRASCDHCHQAKVKCIPSTNNGCQRCLSLHVRCVYSPPGRSGRAPAASKQNSQQRRPNPLEAYNGILQAPDNMSNRHDGTRQSEGQPLTVEEKNDEDGERLPTFMEYDLDRGLLDESQLPAIDATDIFSLNWTTMDEKSLTPAAPLSAAMSDFLTRPTGSLTPTLAAASSLLDATIFDIPTEFRGPSICQCFQKILRTLEGIQQADISQLTLDVALSRNKEALVKICNSLKCPIPHDSTTRLLTLILLRKSLSLYRILYHIRLKHILVGNGNTDTTTNSGTNASSSGSTMYSPSPPPFSLTTPPSSSKSPGYQGFPETRIQPAPPTMDPNRFQDGHPFQNGATSRLTMGSYQLDDADESSVKRHILLLDVEKIPRLLERLDRRACGLDEGDGLDLYSMMRSSLILDVKTTMAEVQT